MLLYITKIRAYSNSILGALFRFLHTNFARVMNQLAEKGGASACPAPAVEEAPAAEEVATEAAAE